MKMRNRSILVMLFVITLANVGTIHAETRPFSLSQSTQSQKRDSVWEGILIGAGIGAVAGMLIAPPAFCGSHDSECATIVRVAIGLPAIAGGIGIGALVDRLHSRRATALSGVQMSWRF